MKKVRNDFRVFEECNSSGKTVWRIKLGGAKGETMTTCRSKEQADEEARQLNIDPYYFDRGFTRADRVASHTLAMKEKANR
jgi:hypothetical protein